jgi:hypothetical protein
MRNSKHTLSVATRRANVVAIIILSIAAPQMSAPPKRPDFSGRWELDSAKSQLRPTKWNNLALTVEHQEPKVKIVVTLKYPQGPDYSYQIRLTTDGKPSSVDMGKNTRVYRSAWFGAKLVIKWNEDGERTETWTLSEDRRTLTITGSSKLTAGGMENWKYVMERK